jgi:superfamily II DNA helicase RecQ
MPSGTICLLKQIQNFEYNVIFADLEHLKRPEWKKICMDETFRNNVVFGTMDEAHLGKKWGHGFRKDFKLVGD